MDLTLKEVAQLLKVSEKTIYRWVKDNKIPYYRINHQYRFRTNELNNWCNTNNKYNLTNLAPKSAIEKPVNIVSNLENGGIYYHLEGNNIKEIINNAVKTINIPAELDKDILLKHLIKREEMAPTAIGNGIAIPHPRTPIISNAESETIFICFLENQIKDYYLDQIPLHTIFIVLNSTPQRHIQLLSKLSFICHKSEFINLLKKRALRSEIMTYIKNLNQ